MCRAKVLSVGAQCWNCTLCDASLEIFLNLKGSRTLDVFHQWRQFRLLVLTGWNVKNLVKVIRHSKLGNVFFLLLAAKVRSSCEEGPGQSALQSAYHDPHLDVTEWKQNRTT